MEFKIDTKPSYTHIVPIGNTIDAKLAGAIYDKWTNLREEGHNNLIVDLQNCLHLATDAIAALMDLHETIYAAEASLVFIGLQDDLIKELKELEIYHIINFVPTLSEAIDIVNMEILERDLFNEE